LHTAEAALRPILNGVQTQEQLDAFIHNLEQLRSVLNNIINCMTRPKRTRGTTIENEVREGIRDPPVHNPKGRPRTQRLTGPTEGRPRGVVPVQVQVLYKKHRGFVLSVIEAAIIVQRVPKECPERI
jgi:hypothetical protein